jgi:hypothetical protein
VSCGQVFELQGMLEDRDADLLRTEAGRDAADKVSLRSDTSE